MYLIDSIANNSTLRETHPMEKFIFSATSMALILQSNLPFIHILMFLITSSIIILRADVSFRDYVKLLMLPTLFILFSMITIIFVTGSAEIDMFFSFDVLGYRLGATDKSISMGLGIFAKTMSALSCLYFLILTTPITDLVYIMEIIRIPAFLREIFLLVYRFIFVLMEITGNIYISQRSRSGYNNLKNSFNSLGILASSVFVKSLSYERRCHQALISRGYESDFNVIKKKYKISMANRNLIILYTTILIAIEIGLRK